MKKIATLLIICALAVLIIPSAVVLPFSGQSKEQVQDIAASPVSRSTESQTVARPPAITVSVVRSETKHTERIVLDDYLIGVVGSEMPPKFRLEALKAQALAARTYIMARIMDNPEAKVSDTVANQVYHSTAELKRLWGKDYAWKIKKVKQAVSETENQVITYQGKLISPVFFSTANGRTENAKDYWSGDVPYLRSVASPWDQLSPKFHNEKKLSVAEVEQALGVSLGKRNAGKTLEKTETGRVARYQIGGKTFTGRQIREKLRLSSTDFTLKRKGNTVTARTVGSGHGVGMSQYGAEGMAREGKKAAQIVTYYYPGTRISKMTIRPKEALVRK